MDPVVILLVGPAVFAVAVTLYDLWTRPPRRWRRHHRSCRKAARA